MKEKIKSFVAHHTNTVYTYSQILLAFSDSYFLDEAFSVSALLLFWAGSLWIVGCYTAFLTSSPQTQIATPLVVSCDDPKCLQMLPWGQKSPPSEDQPLFQSYRRFQKSGAYINFFDLQVRKLILTDINADGLPKNLMTNEGRIGLENAGNQTISKLNIHYNSLLPQIVGKIV